MTTVTAKPVGGRRFLKGVSALKDASGKFDPATKTWAVPLQNWPRLAHDKDVIALSETPVHRGQGVWELPSTGETF